MACVAIESTRELVSSLTCGRIVGAVSSFLLLKHFGAAPKCFHMFLFLDFVKIGAAMNSVPNASRTGCHPRTSETFRNKIAVLRHNADNRFTHTAWRGCYELAAGAEDAVKQRQIDACRCSWRSDCAMNKALETDERQAMEAILAAPASASASRRSRKIGVLGAALLAGAALIAFWSMKGGHAVRYTTSPVVSGNLTVIVTATGSVQPTKKVDVSSELSGTVKSVLVDYNSAVTAGQVLAELDADKLRASVASSRAKLAAARAKLTEIEATVGEKERDVARKKRLISTRAVSAQDLDQSQAAHERAVASVVSAQAEIAVAEADLQMSEANLAKASIRSSINGIVLKRSVDPGQTVASSLQAPVLFSIAENLRQMELQVDVDEADVGKVKARQQAVFAVDAFPEQRFPAVVRDVRFASETVQGVVTYKAILDISNIDLLLRPGMTATAEIRVMEIKDALLVANAALRYAPPAADPAASRSFVSRLLPGPPPMRAAAPRDEGGRSRTVWLLRDGAPVSVKVVTGASDGKQTEVRGLASGDAAITDQSTIKQ